MELVNDSSAIKLMPNTAAMTGLRQAHRAAIVWL
jgi:hypothetical protein